MIQIFWIFLQIGLVSFGGIYSTWALVQKEFVEPCMQQKLSEENCKNAGLITQERFDQIFTVSRIIPGPHITGVSLIGFELEGLTLMLIAMTALLLPGIVIMPLIALFYKRTYSNRYITHFRHGALISMIAILIIFLLGLFRKALDLNHFQMEMYILLAGIAYILNKQWKINPGILVLIGAAAGYIFLQ